MSAVHADYTPLSAAMLKQSVSLLEIFQRDGHELRRDGTRLKCLCPFHEEKTPSCVVAAERFHCFGCGADGDVFDFVARRDGCDFNTARRIVETMAGAIAGQPIAYSPTRSRAESTAREPEKLLPMPVEAMRAWGEGVDYLEATPELAAKLAAFRGWPVEFAQYLVGCASISMPLYHGQRTIAFLVEGPEDRCNALGGQIVMQHLGYHCRLKPAEGGQKASWRFVPNESEHGQRTPGLPFIIGGSWFDSARLLVILEGQWDALTFALAAGWLGEGCLWPKGACVIGIRGAAGINTFLEAYGRFWPKGANCLLLPDTDGAGSKWFDDGDSFADRLARLCRKVAVVTPGVHKDFNDAYRAEEVTTEQIAELLESHGMSLEGVKA